MAGCVDAHVTGSVTSDDGDVGLPNASRVARATDVIGFHCATARSGPGNVADGTNADEMNVIGKTMIIRMLCALSAVAATRPTTAPIHDIANPKNTNRAMPPIALAYESSIRQPTRKPAPIITTMLTMVTNASVTVRPSTMDRRDKIGRAHV